LRLPWKCYLPFFKIDSRSDKIDSRGKKSIPFTINATFKADVKLLKFSIPVTAKGELPLPTSIPANRRFQNEIATHQIQRHTFRAQQRTAIVKESKDEAISHIFFETTILLRLYSFIADAGNCTTSDTSFAAQGTLLHLASATAPFLIPSVLRDTNIGTLCTPHLNTIETHWLRFLFPKGFDEQLHGFCNLLSRMVQLCRYRAGGTTDWSIQLH